MTTGARGQRAPAAGRLGGLRPDRDRLRRLLPHQQRQHFPDLPPDTAWATGAFDQRTFIARRHRLTVAVSNETDRPIDMTALNRLIATATECYS